MKKFRYKFLYEYKNYEGELESPIDIDVYGDEEEKTLKRMLANKHGFGSDFLNSSRSKIGISVHRI